MTLDEVPPVLTVPEAAKLLRVGRNQCYEAIARGELHAIRVGRSIRVPRAALERLLVDPSKKMTAVGSTSAAVREGGDGTPGSWQRA